MPIFQRLANIVGKDNLSNENIDKIVYGYDASILEGSPRLIVWPRSVEQLQNIVKLAITEDLDLVARGAGTGLVGSVIPNDSIVLDFSQMNKINNNLAGAGVILNILNNQLAKQNLWFPVVPSSHKVCTIGGMIACNAIGLRAIKYGKTSDWIQKIKIIDGTAELRELKGEEAKEFCGSEGTLGLIVEAVLKLAELPKQRSLSYFRLNSNSELIAKVNELKKEPNISAIEFVDKIISEDKKIHLLVEYEDSSGEITKQDEMKALWKIREGISLALASQNYVITTDPQTEQIGALLTWLEKNKIPCFGHIGIGVIHPRFKISQTEKIKEMYALVKKLGGKISAEHGIGLMKKAFIDKETKEHFKKLKNKYDPHNIFNKGKLI